ncbi:MAG: flagellar hook-basal body complex protein FliE [Pseudomonadota bacterium]
MNNDIARILAEMRNHAIVAQGRSMAPAQETGGADFSALLKQSIEKVNDLQKTSQHLTRAVELGDPNVSISDAMIAMQKSSLAFEAMVQVRNKVVSAYQEIMSMPV